MLLFQFVSSLAVILKVKSVPGLGKHASSVAI